MAATLIDLVGRLVQALHDAGADADLRRALKCLDVREQQVIRLRFFGGLSQRQIAWPVGVSQMQVSRLEHRALLRLRGFLGDDRPTFEAAYAAKV